MREYNLQRIAIINARSSNIGGFDVQRALPAAKARSVGPFVFLDQMGRAMLQPGKGLDVAPHPHIGLATVTYLFEGELLHRDSLGNVQGIRPGDVNWMTAGRGIVHSERTPGKARQHPNPLFGIQAWVALPIGQEECEPAFAHHAANALPVIEQPGAQLRLIAGTLHGERAPVKTLSRMFYAELLLEAGAMYELDAEHGERAAYVVEGEVLVEASSGRAGQLLVFRPGEPVKLKATKHVRLMLLGGEPPGHRFVWWNFVSSSRERIEKAKQAWRDGKFPSVPGETEFIPLPERKPPPVNYP